MLRYLLEKEFKQIRRDRFMPKIIFIIPIMQLIILPFAANFEMRNINLSIVDNDHSVTSMQLVDKVLSSGYFRLTDRSDRYDEALTSVERMSPISFWKSPLISSGTWVRRAGRA